MQNPKLIPVPFANSGIKDDIPKIKSTSMSDEKASWETGFPEATMLPVYAGGLPPDGKDFNGVLNQISENLVFQSKGGRYKFDPDYALSIGGYPKGATLQTNNESAEYQSLIDNNLVNFNTATPEEIAQAWRITGLGDAIEVLNGKFDKASVKNELGLSETEVVSQRVVTELGSGVVGSFEDGLNFIDELTNSDQLVTLENEFGKQTYCWTGEFPKLVPAGSTPQSTGGIDKGAWVSVGDASLRGDINKLITSFNNEWPTAMAGLSGGEVYPSEINKSISVGDTIPEGIRFVRIDGTLRCLYEKLSASLVVSSYSGTNINKQVELFPMEFFEKIQSGYRIAKSDEQLERLMKIGGSIGIAYSPVSLSGLFQITSDIRLESFQDTVLVNSKQFWIRAPRVWNEENKEFIYSSHNIRLVGNFIFDFYEQNADNDVGVGMALQSGGVIEIDGIETKNAWNANVALDAASQTIINNCNSHHSGRGKIQLPDGSNRQGSAFVINDSTEVFIKNTQTRNTWASSVMIVSQRPGKTTNVQINSVSINTSGGNGLRLQSDDLVNGSGDGTAITRVNIKGITIKNCESHGIRANFRNGSISGAYIESCNVGLSIEAASDVQYSSFTIKNCTIGVLSRFYPVEMTRLRFSNFLISGCSDIGVNFLRSPENEGVNIGDVEFDGLSIHCLNQDSKAFSFNGGNRDISNTDITIRNMKVTGAHPLYVDSSLIDVIHCRHINVDCINLIRMNGAASSYLRASAGQSIMINRLTGVQPIGSVYRPIQISGSARLVNIVNCATYPTAVKDVGYESGTPAKMFEGNNQFET